MKSRGMVRRNDPHDRAASAEISVAAHLSVIMPRAVEAAVSPLGLSAARQLYDGSEVDESS